MEEVQMEQYNLSLEQHTRETENDIRIAQCAIYTNKVLGHFGKERVYLVGSTAEKTKLVNSKDDGDTDFLMVSGIYEINVDQLEFNEDNKRYLQIRADDKSKTIGLETKKDKYIAANSLRVLKPELFTLLRAFYTHLTASRYRLQELAVHETVISVSSKVGLAVTRYINLKLDKTLLDELEQRRPQSGNTYKNTRSKETSKSLAEQWKDVEIHESDIKMLLRIYKVLKEVVIKSDVENEFSQLMFMVHLIDDCMKRTPPHNFKSELFYSGTVEETSSNDPHDRDDQYEGTQGKVLELVKLQHSYRKKIHVDFVPAIRLNGKLDLMKRWKDRVEKAGMDSKLIDDIYDTDIFVVSRVAPNSSDFETDFCLSFNLAETKLVLAMTSMQKKVFLIMKAFLKGVFTENHQKNNKELKLKTYHIKNALFWLFESHPELKSEENIMPVLGRATKFLKDKLDDSRLYHYFVDCSNLFSDFEENDYCILKECVHEVLTNPIKSIERYFAKEKRRDLVFTAEELECLLEMSSDGGRNTHLDRLEESMVDLVRGFYQGRREKMGSKIKKMLIDVFQLFLKDEHAIDTKIHEQIKHFVSKRQKNTTDEVDAEINATVDRLNAIGVLNPDVKQFVVNFYGRPTLKHFMSQGFIQNLDDFFRMADYTILNQFGRCLSCQDDEDHDIDNELIELLIGGFSNRKEFYSLSELNSQKVNI